HSCSSTLKATTRDTGRTYPSDCFEMAMEAVRIATAYRTPVILLSDGYIANGSEPWRIPEINDLPDLTVEFAQEPNHVNEKGEKEFLPYLRDPETLARPWAPPGVAGLEHRIGGLEKQDKTGAISYDPANHDFMVRTRQAKIDAIAESIPSTRVKDPSGKAKVLVLGWGSTYGPIKAACREVRKQGIEVARVHLRHLNPFPKDLGEVLKQYDKVIIPEMNLGQLALLIRGKFLVDAISYNQIRGLPFTSAELVEVIKEVAQSVSN
ncbi:MAG: 2-oxoglutarate ferredoxin oxidoreductase subunit alpha, partial [Candidatus Nanopelagicales bacterium]